MENKEQYYPSTSELTEWIDGMYRDAEQADFTAEVQGPFLPCNYGQYHASAQLVKFTRDGHSYWGVWSRKQTGGASPLLVHLPGYGAELSCHYDVAALGYNLLQLSPLGYWTPEGFDLSLQKDGNWPVLPDTVRTDAKGGYREWLMDAICAVFWAWKQENVIPDRVSFYGTSQGGGTALLMGSVFAGRGTACVCADEPFLTNYPLADFRGAYEVAVPGCDDVRKNTGDESAIWHAFGFIDTICHAKRMDYPVLLTAGGKDEICPPETVASLYERLPQTKSLTYLHTHVHGYNVAFIKLSCGWFSLFA